MGGHVKLPYGPKGDLELGYISTHLPTCVPLPLEVDPCAQPLLQLMAFLTY